MGGVTGGGGWGRRRMGVWAALLFLVQVHHAHAFGIPEFLVFGNCPDLQVDPNINFEKFSGIWFNMEDVPNEYTDIVACSMANYTWLETIMTVDERGLNVDGKKVRKNSLMRPTEGQPGVLTVDAEGVPSAPYAIVGTDYDNYACVHSCMGFMGFKAAFSWVFTRVPNPDRAYVALCRDLLAENGIEPSAMQPMRQGKDCPYTEKLDALLAYSKGVQSKAKAKEMAEDKKSSTKKTHQIEPINAVPQEATVTQESIGTIQSSVVSFILDEEKHLRELEHEMEEEERRLKHTMEMDHRREEEEIEEIREEVIYENRRHRHEGGHRAEHAAGGGEHVHLSSLAFVLPVVSLLLPSSL
ncbi:uncharacterized protein LOC121862135 [Homarus americanus]|uniref:Crustacyanin-A2 subunit-like 4 n=1 Tax=Homarus americanus TaxID=6706 RepID=A0A8J5N315_HOMAM|nr:uncharacterized protein LOC121862135 [Homarus americanus]XP_042216090.1 uncharacterized protein LOC121862135 [Homarus americanus]KAG7172265.1 Crustacyanin-A2 subunit-like 4 [Homarus americanus]